LSIRRWGFLWTVSAAVFLAFETLSAALVRIRCGGGRHNA
jgi:hypothetical protein